MREFLKWIAASAIGTLVGLLTFSALVGLGVGGAIAYLVATAAQEAEPEVAADSILVLDLALDIQDAVPSRGAGAVLEETLSRNDAQALSIYQTVHAIKQAAEDENILGLYIHGNSSEGFATLRELRQAIAAFQETGKPVIAYEIGASERDYYITSLADTLILNESGRLEMNGFQAETQFLAGALEKYGIGVQILQAGRYKSAVEPFIRTDSSAEAQEQTQALLEDLWQEFLTAVAAARSLPQSQLQQIADTGGILLASEAQELGLVDQIGYYDDVLTTLRDITGEDESVGEEITSVDVASYSRIIRSPSDADEIAVVYANGGIVMGNGREAGIGVRSFSRTLRQLRQDEAVKAVVLRINSPGGGATAAEILTDAIRRLNAEKPVIISMGNAAASGGYMMATGAEYIFASPSTITGSIGVFGLLLNWQEIANRNGVTWDSQKTAEYADMGTVSRPQTPAEIALQQSVVNELYDRFLTLVAESQDLTKAAADGVAQGRVWSGEDALSVGLVDELGGLDAAIAYAAEQAELDTWQVQEYPRPRFLELQIFERVFSRAAGRGSFGSHPFATEWDNLQATAQLLRQLEDPHGIYTRLPFTTRIR